MIELFRQLRESLASCRSYKSQPWIHLDHGKTIDLHRFLLLQPAASRTLSPFLLASSPPHLCSHTAHQSTKISIKISCCTHWNFFVQLYKTVQLYLIYQMHSIPVSNSSLYLYKIKGITPYSLNFIRIYRWLQFKSTEFSKIGGNRTNYLERDVVIFGIDFSFLWHFLRIFRLK